jgi:flagellar protein FliS
MSTAVSQEYLKNAVLTASPEQLQLMLFDGAIRFALQGRKAIEAGDIEGTYNHLTRAQKIVIEMQNGLNFDVNQELCEKMSALYTFIYRKLVDANINKDVSAIEDALKILQHQRETWVLLMEKIQKEGRGGATAGEPSRPERTPPARTPPPQSVPDASEDPGETSINIEG